MSAAASDLESRVVALEGQLAAIAAQIPTLGADAIAVPNVYYIDEEGKTSKESSGGGTSAWCSQAYPGAEKEYKLWRDEKQGPTQLIVATTTFTLVRASAVLIGNYFEGRTEHGQGLYDILIDGGPAPLELEGNPTRYKALAPGLDFSSNTFRDVWQSFSLSYDERHIVTEEEEIREPPAALNELPIGTPVTRLLGAGEHEISLYIAQSYSGKETETFYIRNPMLWVALIS